MPNEIFDIILKVILIVATGLASWVTGLLISWINSKIKDGKVAKWLTQITTIIMNAVQEVFQTYVDTLKKEGKFDKEAQKIALERALTIVKSQLSGDMIKFIQENFGDIEAWLINQIESMIYQLKNN